MIDTVPDASHSRAFLADGGEMGRLIRAYDWTSTPLGAPETWPASLRATVRLMLNSRHPMFIWWGEDLIQLYNDAYRQTMGPEMHPAALGARGRESWADIWPIIGPQIEKVMSEGAPTWNVDQLVPIRRHGRREDVWWTYGYSPIDLDDGVGGVLVVCNDVTRQHRLTEELRTRTARMARQVEQAPGFIAVLAGPEQRFELANAAYRRLVGDRDVVGLPVREAFPDLEDQGFFELLDDVYRTGMPYVGRRLPITFGTEKAEPTRWIDFVYQPIVESDGSISGVFVEGQDVTEHVKAEERLAMINDELRHRVKNMIAVIGAVANQTLRHGSDPEALAAFQSRLVAFGTAHEALTNGQDAAGRVEDVIHMTLDPHLRDPDRCTVSGPMLLLGAKQAVSLALTVHELATNASKYGALSSDAGRVDISWTDTAGTFVLRWRESGGPAVAAPQKLGFGSRLMETVIATDLGGSATSDFHPDGLAFTLTAPTGRLGP